VNPCRLEIADCNKISDAGGIRSWISSRDGEAGMIGKQLAVQEEACQGAERQERT